MKPTPRLSFLIVFLTALLAAGQAFALDPARNLAQYTHTKWTIADGAPADINTIVQSADGYLWLATSTGLYRFDGVTFERIPPIEGDASRSEAVTALLAVPSGDIWVGYYIGGIAVYHDGELRDFNHGPPLGIVSKFARDADGGIWVATTGVKPIGLSRYLDGKWQTFDAASGIPREFFKGILAAPDGTVSVVTRDSVLVLRRGSNRFERVGEQPSVMARDDIVTGKVGLATDARGRAWISDCRGIRLLDDGAGIDGVGNGSAATGPCPGGGAIPRSMIFDRDGNIWGTTNTNGIVRIRPASPKTGFPPGSGDTFGETDGLSSNTTGGIVEDTEGDIWISTSSGLDRFRAANVVVETSIPPSAADHYLAFRDANGSIDIGDGHTFYKISSKTDPIPIRDVIPGIATHVCVSIDDKTWVVTESHDIFEIEHGRLKKFATSIMPASWRDLACAVDKYGALWISAETHGLYRFDGLNLTEISALKDEPHVWPRTLSVDIQGRLLVYFARRSLVRIDGDRVETLLAANDNKIGIIPVIAPAARYILLGGENGLSLVNSDRVTTLTSSQYPWLRHINGITQTRRGETWLVGIDQIIRLSTPELEQAFEKPGAPLGHEVFDVNDGLPNFAGFNGLGFSRSNDLEDSDGRIWFTITDHAAWIDPAHLTRNPLPPPVSIQRLIANDRPYTLPLSGALPKGVSKLEIDYTALSLSLPQRDRFRYRLEGVDGDWVDPGTRRQAFYTNLGPGRYRFTVIAANNDGVWNRTGATVAFDIPPTFVQSDLFLAVCIVLALALAWLLYTLRLRQMAGRIRGRLEERLAERERIARELHDTLIQGFQGLLLRFQAVADEMPVEHLTHQKMERALDLAEEVLVEGRDRVRNLRTTEASGELSQMLANVVNRMELDSQIGVRVIVESTPRALQPLVYDEIVAIGKEALSNILRHAKARAIEIYIRYDRRQLEVKFIDDGIGIDEALLAQGREGHFGLAGMRERAAKIRASFVIASRVGAGTEIQLVVPANVAYARNGKGVWRWPSRQPELREN